METVLIASIAISMLAFGALKLLGDPERRRAQRALAAARWLTATSRDGAVVKVTGVVRAARDVAPFLSPLGGVPCVAYRVQARIRGLRGTTTGLHDLTRARPFVIERDAAGPMVRVVVDSAHALLATQPERPEAGPFERRVELLGELGFDEANAARSELEEAIIPVGAEVTVAGTLTSALEAPHGRAELGYRDSGKLAIRLVGDREHPVAIGPVGPV
jgi:hypothetical protein